MSSTIPKQFISVAGKPILIHTLEAFRKADKDIELILVLPLAHMDSWSELSYEYGFHQNVKVVQGGATRFQSVSNGLAEIPFVQGTVAVHDAVRPCIDSHTIVTAYQSAEKNDSGVVCVKLKDSIREKKGESTISRDRDSFYLVQTPQVFDVTLLKNAYKQSERSHFTDDASVFEAAGHDITPVEGDYKNIKVTTDEDLMLVEAILSNKKP